MLLEVKNLRIAFRLEGRETVPVRDVTFSVPEHGRVAIVGESGCGKSLTALSLARLSPTDRARISGETKFNGRISYVFQNPSDSLNPVMRIADQIREALPKDMPKKAQNEKIVELLARTGLPDPARAAHAYPCELSGGQQQRCMIAMALAATPDLLVADEPTTALDVTIQAQVLEMMRDLKEKFGTSILMITHDLGVVAQMCQKVAIMYAGEIVESGTVYDIFDRTAHPYTEGLLGAIPKVHLQERRLRPIDGLMPDPMELPAGCAFCERCKYAQERCSAEHPPMVLLEGEHYVRCFRAEQGREEDKA
jgi:peptide/nickel transport system ATP-binding protein